MDILLFAVKNFAAFFGAGTNSHHSSQTAVGIAVRLSF